MPSPSTFKTKFKPATRDENALLEAFAVAQSEVDWASQSPNSDAALPDTWHSDQTVRPSFFTSLCKEFVREHGNEAVIAVGGVRFLEDLNLSEFHTPLALKFDHCRFEGRLDVSESHFFSLDINYSWLTYLRADSLVVDETLSLEESTVLDWVGLDGAKIGSYFLCTSLKLGRNACAGDQQSTGTALTLQDAQVGRTMFLDKCVVNGTVNLAGTHIGGDIDCTDGTFQVCRGSSFILEKVEIDGEFLFEKSSGNTWSGSIGVISISNSTIKNGIVADHVSFRLANSADRLHRSAIEVTGSEIHGFSWFREDSEAEGISLLDSEFGSLHLLGKVGGSGISLKDTKAQFFHDNRKYWPPINALHVDGFVYDNIRDEYEDPDRILVERRLDWLARDPDKSTQPYRQLADVLKRQGDDDGATVVLEAMEKRLMDTAKPIQRAELTLLEPFGFGYNPQKSFWMLLGLTGIGWIIYRRSYLAGAIVPTDRDAYQQFKSQNNIPPQYPRFSPFIYSLENTFPLVNLGQASQWQPDPTDLLTSNVPPKNHDNAKQAPRKNRVKGLWRLIPRSRGDALRIFLWAQILLGWLLATLFVTGVSGFIRR